MVELDRLRAEEDEEYVESSGSSVAKWVIAGIIIFIIIVLIIR